MTRIVRSRDFNKKPLWLNAINKIYKNFIRAEDNSFLNKDKLIQRAKELTGLSDLGREFWDEPFERLIHSIRHEARLHPAGLYIIKKRLINLLATRLKAEYWFKKHPEILETPIYPVTMIVGLQRTGTTKLHRLLAANPATRTLLSWEAINPAPPVDWNPKKDPRKIMARISELVLRIMSPKFFAIHPVEHLAPEEDILLLDVSFLSTTPEATMNVPSYASWLEKTDQDPAYIYSAKLLKLLQWQRPSFRWVLKSPHHLEFLKLVEKYYGNVSFIWTHRNVMKSIPSFLSMVAHGRVIFSDFVDINSIRDHWLKKSGTMLSAGLDFRFNQKNNHKFTDIFYDRFLASPLKTLRYIYKRQNLSIKGLEEQVRLAENSDKHDTFGNHNYDLSDFNLSEDDIRKHTGPYEKLLYEISNLKGYKLPVL